MSKNSAMTRRSALAMMAGAAGAVVVSRSDAKEKELNPLDGRIKQSVCKWCYPKQSVEELCLQGKAMGLQSVELLTENEWAITKKHGLTCAMGSGLTSISDGWNRVENHDKFVKDAEHLISAAKEAGIPTLICFSGNRKGMSDEEGMENCA